MYMAKHLIYVEAVNEIIAVASFKGAVNLHVRSAYAPTAEIATQETHTHTHTCYKQLEQEIQNKERQGCTIVGADMNERLIEQADGGSGNCRHVF